MKRFILFSLILVVIILNISLALAQEKQPVILQPVVFINTAPDITALGLVKFEVNKDKEPISYKVMYEMWKGEEKTILLGPGFYGVVQYNPDLDIVVGYHNFWVKDKPLSITMRCNGK